MVLARPASTYNAVSLSEIEKWSPTNHVRQFLLISGASKPPDTIAVSDRRPRGSPNTSGGKFLKKVTSDLLLMEEAVTSSLRNTIRDLRIKKADALTHIDELLKFCRENGFKPMLYYTGHGEVDTGNWCFSDGSISIEEIFDRIPGDMVYPTIISDACYSGRWANYCFIKGIAGFECLSACGQRDTALDTGSIS